jgi:hypothetical protein
MKQIELQKSSISKIKYPQIIDIEFTQLINNEEIIEDEITVDDFFEIYDRLFYDIPLEGNIGSHRELIIRSTEYVGEVQNTEEIDLLLDEINQLRLELLEARQLIDELTK